MGKIQRRDIEWLSRHLSVKLVEALQINFECHGRNCHAFNRIYLILSEHGGNNFIRNHSGNEYFHLKSGHIYFMPANTDLEFSFCADMDFISFHFYLELFNCYDIFSLQKNFAEITGEAGYLDIISRQIREGRELEALCYLQGTVMCLASKFIQNDAGELEQVNKIARKYGKLFEFIREQADATTTVDMLAEAAAMPRDTLSREFSRDCGITLKHYLSRELIRRSENMLLSPGVTARRVAEKLKFNNEYYFSRFFKKHTGRTPGEYRYTSINVR